MLHIPSYELGKTFARFDIASGNVKDEPSQLRPAIDKALDPDGDAEGYALSGFKANGGMPFLFPLSIIEDYFEEVIRHRHAEAKRLQDAIASGPSAGWGD